MGGKHMKRLRAEKAKVQLKKKKLPKGQNITDTAFKVRRIQTIEQLKKVDKDEPVSNWNVPLKDLLIRLNHYNYTSRLNSLNGIRELLTNYPEILQGPSFKLLVTRLLDLLTDEEHKIRLMTMDLLSFLFDLIPPSALQPLYDNLSVHLGCAMTHRNASIQRDSLKFIDVMIKYASRALQHNFTTIAQNFIRIIKKSLNEPSETTLKGSKLNLEQSKTEMFSRFYQFISSGMSDVAVEKQTICRSIDTSNLTGQEISLRQVNDQYKQTPDLSSLFLSSDKKSTSIGKNHCEEFQSLCTLIVPLLLDTWVEFCPNQKQKGAAFETVLSDGIAALLNVILKILMFLYERATAMDMQMDKWFVSSYGQTFQKCFTPNFPYSASVSRKRSSSGKPIDFASPSCIFQNLVICYLSYSFKLVHENSKVGTAIENYITWALEKKNPTEITTLSKVIQAAIKSSQGIRNRILNKLVSAYESTQNSELREELLKTLVRVVVDDDESTWRTEQSITNWMKSLPGHMCTMPMFKEVIAAVLQLVNRLVGAEVLKEVEMRSGEIMENMVNFKTEGVPDYEGQKMIADILYRCDNTVLEELLKKEVLREELYSQNIRNYIKNIFSHKLSTRSIICV